MQIQLHQTGGIAYFPALERPIDVDTSALPEDEAAVLERLVSEVEGSDLASATPPAPCVGGDRRQYIVKVDDGTPRSFTLRDPLGQSSSADLVRRLKSYRNATS